MKTRKSKRPFKVYTVIGDEWFTLLAAKVRTVDGTTLLGDVVNLSAKGKVLDAWSEVRLARVPLLVARE